MSIGRIHGLPFFVIGNQPRSGRGDVDLGPSAFTILFRLITRSMRRRSERRAIASLSDHLLRDIGVSRTQAAWDAELPFRRR